MIKISLPILVLFGGASSLDAVQVSASVFRSTAPGGWVVHISLGSYNNIGRIPRVRGFYSDNRVRDDESRVRSTGYPVPGAAANVEHYDVDAALRRMDDFASRYAYHWWSNNCGACVDFAIQGTLKGLITSQSPYKTYAIWETSRNIAAQGLTVIYDGVSSVSDL